MFTARTLVLMRLNVTVLRNKSTSLCALFLIRLSWMLSVSFLLFIFLYSHLFFLISCMILVSIYPFVTVSLSLSLTFAIFLSELISPTDDLFVYHLQFGHHHQQQRSRHNAPMFNSCILLISHLSICSKFKRWACVHSQIRPKNVIFLFVYSRMFAPVGQFWGES